MNDDDEICMHGMACCLLVQFQRRHALASSSCARRQTAYDRQVPVLYILPAYVVVSFFSSFPEVNPPTRCRAGRQLLSWLSPSDMRPISILHVNDDSRLSICCFIYLGRVIVVVVPPGLD